MKALLLDAFGGLAGDMLLGGLVDLGVEAEALREVLRSLDLPNWSMAVDATTRQHLGCTKVTFEVADETDHRHLPDILQRIERSELSNGARERASRTFRRLAEAEAAVHRIAVDRVHFHEVGAADAILDICGVSAALELLGVDTLFSNPLPTGRGTVDCAHGRMPVPVPAVVELLGDFDLVSSGKDGEQITPTGAALLAANGRMWARGVPHRVGRTGYGAGTRASSVLRVTEVELTEHVGDDLVHDEVVVLRTHLDDMTPEALAFLADRLTEAGALDVAFGWVTMKKGRPGHALTCMVAPDHRGAVVDVLFAESTTLGVREQRVTRSIVQRRVETVQTPWGPARVKRWRDRVSAEYDDAARIAREHALPLRVVMRGIEDAAGQ